MDAPPYNGEPGAMPYDDEERAHTDNVRALSCDDCGVTGTDGYTLVGSTGKVLCGECSRRRGIAYLFDERPWSMIARALQGKSA